MIFQDATCLVGRTPMVELGRIAKDLPGRVLAKLEMRNPGGSVKDRLAASLIADAENRGVLRPGMTIIEPTGGNTGIGLALIAAIRGYHAILTMPEDMSRERVALLRHLGAEVVLTGGILMQDAVDKARELVRENPGSLMLDQFANPANPEAHRRTTGVEIWQDTEGRIDAFVCAVGTGGTITGTGEALKARNPDLRVIAVEPAGSAVLSGGRPGPHLMPGIGVGFVPEILNRSLLNEVIAVTDEEALECARRVARVEGILAGISSGAALHAALAVASRDEFAGKTVAVLMADTAERYVFGSAVRRGLPARTPRNVGFQGEADQEDPNGVAHQATVEGEGREDCQDCVGGHGRPESVLHPCSFWHGHGLGRRCKE